MSSSAARSSPVALRRELLSADERIAILAERLSNRARVNAHHGDTYSWEQATDYVLERAALKLEDPKLSPQALNRAIRSAPEYVGPGAKFLSDAWRVHQTWPELFLLTGKSLPYSHVHRIANSRVPDKNAVRAWAEASPRTQAELRAYIAELVGDDTVRRGFRLQTTNHWRFPSNDGFDRSGFDGGIHHGVVANLVHYLTEPGELVVDPMAGSGRLAEVMQLPYFRREWINTDDADNGGPRQIAMSDIKPMRKSIVRADARKALKVTGAKLIVLDPPYWRIARGKYAHGGDAISDWLAFLHDVLTSCHAALESGGWLALVLDDYMRSHEEQPLALLGATVALDVGFVPQKTIYNNYTNACTTDAIGMWRAKRARMMLNGMKIINIFKKA